MKFQKDQEVYYDDVLFIVEEVFDTLDQALEYTKEYLNVENSIVTFDKFIELELEFLTFKDSCLLLRGEDEQRGQHSPLIVSTEDEDLLCDID